MNLFTVRITLLTDLLSALSLWPCSDDTQYAMDDDGTVIAEYDKH